MKKYSIEQITVTAIIVSGVITSLIQFLYNPSFWQDEAALALNIIHRNSCGLLAPLDYGQVAPILFLQIEKLFSTVLPNSEYGLRLFPLLCFWASILLFCQIVKKQSDSIYAKIIALSCFALGYMFIYYSNEVKQYMSDVFVLLCVFYCLLKDCKKDKNKYYLLGIIGVLAVFLSNVTPIILFTCGIYLLYDVFFCNSKKNIKNIMPLFIVFAVWLSAFLLYYCLFIYEHPHQEFMVKYWSNAFLPSNPFTSDFYVFLFRKVPVKIFSVIFGLDENKIVASGFILLFILLFITGIIDLIKQKNIKLIILSCTPLFLHLILSSLQLYPFERRLILYTLPCSIIVCSFGFDYISNVIFPKLKIEKFKLYVLISFMAIICIQLFVRFPIKKMEVKECIKYVQNDTDTDKSIYNFLYASIVFQYYKDIGCVNNEINVLKPLDFEHYMLNNDYSRSDLYINDLKGQLHNKVWLLISEWDKKNFILKIDSLGYNRIKEFKTKGASIYLYDFGE